MAERIAGNLDDILGKRNAQIWRKYFPKILDNYGNPERIRELGEQMIDEMKRGRRR